MPVTYLRINLKLFGSLNPIQFSWRLQTTSVLPLFLHLLEGPAGEVAAHPGLQPAEDLREAVITELLHLTQHSGTEEHLVGQPRSVEVSRG